LASAWDRGGLGRQGLGRAHELWLQSMVSAHGARKHISRVYGVAAVQVRLVEKDLAKKREELRSFETEVSSVSQCLGRLELW
jgi:hypothetical protein